jgi:hypothetical protein
MFRRWRRRWLQELQREDAIRAHDQAQEFETKTNEATVASGQVAIRTAILINGGAAIAVLGLIGGLVGQGKLRVAQLSSVTRTLMWLAFGAASGIAALACRDHRPTVSGPLYRRNVRGPQRHQAPCLN